MDTLQENQETKDWRKVKNLQRFLNAYRGLVVFWQATRHIYLHVGATVLAIVLGVVFKLNNLEWVAIVFAIALVLIAEVFNTAIEIDIDLTSPEYHPYARDTKDVAAGAVLLASFFSAVIALFVFVPKICLYVKFYVKM